MKEKKQKKIKETQSEEYLRRIVELLESQARQPIFPPQYNYPMWCSDCGVYNCGKMHVTC